MAETHLEQDQSAFDGPPIIYARYDDGFVVRSMTSSDIQTVENWWLAIPGTTMPRDDLTLALKSFKSSDRGFYIGTFNDQPVAAFIAVNWGNGFCYGGLWIVDEKYRGHKFGIRIRDEVALSDVGPARTLCLHSIAGRVANMNLKYLGYRNVASHETVRNFGGVPEVCGGDTSLLPDSIQIMPAACVDFENLIQYDNKCFVSQNFASRRHFLRLLIHVQDGASFVAVNGTNGEVVGFTCRRPASAAAHHRIGPLYADSQEIAESLFAKLCEDIPGENVRVTFYGEHVGSSTLVEKFKLQLAFDLVHQHINAEPASGVECKSVVYFVTSVSVCGA